MTTRERLTMAAAMALGFSAAAYADNAQQPTGAPNTVQSVFEDAQISSKFFAAGDAGAGWDDKGPFIKGDMGELRPGFQFQFRGVAQMLEDGKNGDEDSTQTGFEIRRMKFSAKGWAFSKALKYDFVWQAERSGGGVGLEDATVSYALSDDMTIGVGQKKDPVFHEELVSSKRQLAVDRSLLNEVLAGGKTDRPQGVFLQYGSKASPIRAEVMLHDGAGTRNTNFQDTAAYWGASGRIEFKPMGVWGDYDDFSAMNTKETLLVVGGGLDVTDQVGGTAIWGTIDAQYEMPDPKLGIYAAFIMKYTDFRAGGSDSRMDWGFLVQAGWSLSQQMEVFGRFNMVMLDEDFLAPGAEDTAYEITVGLNYYLTEKAGHNAKVTVDLGFLPNGSPESQSGLAISSGDGSQIYLRCQLQLAAN